MQTPNWRQLKHNRIVTWKISLSYSVAIWSHFAQYQLLEGMGIPASCSIAGHQRQAPCNCMTVF